MNQNLVNDLVMTAEISGTTLSDGAAALIAAELTTYDPAQVAGALRKCRRELKGRLTMAAIIERLDDGRPGPEEAWAMMPRDESQSVVWTDEMAAAFGVAGPLMFEGDMVAARMAFKETYAKAVGEARDARKPVNWTASLGHDKTGRDGALALAIQHGRLTHKHAVSLGYSPESQDMMALVFNDEQMRQLRQAGLMPDANT